MATTFSISQKVCARHHDRPAVARCRECVQPYCRECVVEHESRLICAGCLKNGAARQREMHRRRWQVVPLAGVVQWGVGVVVIWALFYWVAIGLRRLPAAVHEGLQWAP